MLAGVYEAWDCAKRLPPEKSTAIIKTNRRCFISEKLVNSLKGLDAAIERNSNNAI
jgi:hypothetical protein